MRKIEVGDGDFFISVPCANVNCDRELPVPKGQRGFTAPEQGARWYSPRPGIDLRLVCSEKCQEEYRQLMDLIDTINSANSSYVGPETNAH